MSVNIPIKMLTLGPLIRSISCHYNLLLMGKLSMTGMILTFPGMQPTGHETRMSAWPSDARPVAVKACMSAPHAVMRWNNLLSLWMGLCMLISFQSANPGGILLDIRNSSLLFTSFSTTNLHPAAWTCTAGPWANDFGLSLGQEKEERVTTLGTTTSFSFGAI